MLKQGFILHSRPVPFLDENGEVYYARIPQEELELLEGTTWPVCNEHPNTEDGSPNEEGNKSGEPIGTAFDTTIKSDHLHAGTININMSEDKWAGKELSTGYSCRSQKLSEPYPWLDMYGELGKPGGIIPVSVHHRDIRNAHLSLVPKGRFGSNVAIREQNNVLVLNEYPMIDKPTLPGVSSDLTEEETTQEVVENSKEKPTETPKKETTPVVENKKDSPEEDKEDEATDKFMKNMEEVVTNSLSTFFNSSAFEEKVNACIDKRMKTVSNAAPEIKEGETKIEESPKSSSESDIEKMLEKVLNNALSKANLNVPAPRKEEEEADMVFNSIGKRWQK